MCWLSLGHSHPQQHDDDRVHSIHQGDDDDDSIIITIIGAYGNTHTRTHHSRRRFTILTWLARTRSTLTHSITLSTHYFWSKQSQTMEKERTEREEGGRRKIFFLPSLLWPLELTAAAVVVVVVAAAAAALVAESMFPHFRPTTIRPSVPHKTQGERKFGSCLGSPPLPSSSSSWLSWPGGGGGGARDCAERRPSRRGFARSLFPLFSVRVP